MVSRNLVSLKPAGRRHTDGIKHNAGGDRADHQMSAEQLTNVTPGASPRVNRTLNVADLSHWRSTIVKYSQPEQIATKRRRREGGVLKSWGLPRPKGGFKTCVFVARYRYVPPLRRGGRGGLRGIASTLGPCDNSVEDIRPGTAHQAVVTRGYPPCPPFSRLIITHNYSRSFLPAWKPATSKVRS